MTLRTVLLSSLLTLGTSIAFAQTPTTPATKAPTTTATTSATMTDDLREYAGTYTFASGSPISAYTITVKDGSLQGDAGMGEYKLLKQEKADQFKSTSSYGSIITFVRNAATKVITGLTLAAQGQELTATRDK